MSANKVFISYSRKDSAFALALAQEVRAAGVDIWIDQLDIHVGDLWDVSVENALANASCVLVILSPFSISSNNVQDEIAYALDSDKRIIPVILEECTIPFRLRRWIHIDFSKDFQEGFRHLMAALDQPTIVQQKVLQFAGNKISSTEHYFDRIPSSQNTVLAKSAIAALEKQERSDQPKPQPKSEQAITKEKRARKLISKTYIIICSIILIIAAMGWMIVLMNVSKEEAASVNSTQANTLEASFNQQLFPAPVFSLEENQVVNTAEVKESSNTISTEKNIPPTKEAGSTATNDEPVKSASNSKTNKSLMQIGHSLKGGIIIYVDTTGEHGIIASEKELGDMNFETALKKCASFKSGGEDDWRLPSKEELNMIYEYRAFFYSISPGMFWSSTEVDKNTAAVQNLFDGRAGSFNKGMSCNVKPVRNF